MLSINLSRTWKLMRGRSKQFRVISSSSFIISSTVRRRNACYFSFVGPRAFIINHRNPKSSRTLQHERVLWWSEPHVCKPHVGVFPSVGPLSGSQRQAIRVINSISYEILRSTLIKC